MSSICQSKEINSGLKKIAIESLLSIAERLPNLYRVHNGFLSILIEILLAEMSEFNGDLEENEYFADFESDPEYENIVFGMNSLDKLLFSIGKQQIFPIFSKLLQIQIHNNNWKTHQTIFNGFVTIWRIFGNNTGFAKYHGATFWIHFKSEP